MAVGQMMAASFGGPNVTDGLRHLILDQKVGTVLIFGDNFTDAASLGRLTTELQAIGREAGLPAPLLVAVDEEGGRVMRIHDGVAPLPSELELGAVNVVVQPGQWPLPRVDHLGLALPARAPERKTA